MISISSAELNALLAAYLWPLARILAFILSAPILSNPALPLRVRVALAMMITLIVAPNLGSLPPMDPASLTGLLILAQQIVIGVALGFAIRIVFVAVEMAGELAGLQMGLGFATFFDPENAGQSPVVGQFLGIIATLAFLAIDGHLLMVYHLSQSFSALPVGTAGLDAPSFIMLVSWGAEIFRAGVLLALPFLAGVTDRKPLSGRSDTRRATIEPLRRRVPADPGAGTGHAESDPALPLPDAVAPV